MKIENVRIINHDTIVDNADIIIEDGKIVSIMEKEGIGELTAVPGFFDSHTHGLMGIDASDGVEANEKISEEMGKLGTTSYTPTLITDSTDNLMKQLSEISSARHINAKIVGIHMEGPHLSIPKKGAHKEHLIIKATNELMDSYQKAANGLVRKVTICPKANDLEVLKYMLTIGMFPNVGHTDASYEEAQAAFGIGANSCTHLFNAMSGPKNRAPGTVTAVLNNDNVFAEIIFDGVHVDWATVELAIGRKGYHRVVAVTDSIRPAGMPDGEYMSGGTPVIKVGSSIKLKGTDTIAGSGSTMHMAFKNIIKHGYGEKAAVAMTSYNPAIGQGLKNIGAIKIGMLADIVLLDKDLEINKVFIEGREI